MGEFFIWHACGVTPFYGEVGPQNQRTAPAGGRLPRRGRWTGRSPGRMRGAQPSRKTGPDEWVLPGRSLSQPTADSSLYAREPLYRPRSELFIGARLFSVAGHPSSVRAYALPPSPWGKATSGGGLGYRALWDGEVFPLIRQGFALPPSPWGKASSGGGGAFSAGDEITVRCRRRTGPACRGLRGRRRRARGGR